MNDLKVVEMHSQGRKEIESTFVRSGTWGRITAKTSTLRTGPKLSGKSWSSPLPLYTSANKVCLIPNMRDRASPAPIPIRT